MKRYDFHVPIYDWNITILADIDPTIDVHEIRNILDPYDTPESQIQETMKLIRTKVNYGETYWNPINLRQICMLGKFSDLRHLLKNIRHEFNHIIYAISKTHELDMEAVAYLDGWFTVQLYDSGFYDDIIIDKWQFKKEDE